MTEPLCVLRVDLTEPCRFNKAIKAREKQTSSNMNFFKNITALVKIKCSN